MTVIRTGTAGEVASAAARATHEALQEGAGTTRHLALTGGTTGIEIVRSLVALMTRAPCEDVHVWWGDERFVRREDDQRNDLQAIEAGLGELDLPPDLVHHVAGSEECALDRAADAYESAVRELVPVEQGWPAMDVVLLGAGEDGHIASLFPGREWEDGERCVVPVRNSPKPPGERVSLTMPVLVAAHTVILGITGAAKAEALARALAGDATLPLGHLLSVRAAKGRKTLLYADAEALPR